MQPEYTHAEYRSRIGVVCVIALIALVMALITIFVAITLVFNSGWALDYTRTTCPQAQPIVYLKQVKIKEIIFTVFLVLWSTCLFIIAGLAFKHKIDVTYQPNLPTKYRPVYPLFISLALISAVVCLFIIVKIYISIGYVRDLSDNGQIPLTCLTTVQYNDLIYKLNPGVIVIVLLAIMWFLTVLIFVCLPYRYFVLSGPIQDQVYLPLERTQRIKQTEKRKVSKFQISHQELLEQPVKPERIFQSIAVGNDEPYVIPLPEKVLEKVIQPVKYLASIGVGGDLRPKIVHTGVNCSKIQLRNTCVGDHIELSDKKTDCEGLIEQKQIKVEPPRSLAKIEERNYQSPVRDGYYYLTTHPQAISLTEEHRSARKVESIQSSGRKLLNNPLRASQGSKEKDRSHLNLVEAGSKINHIYTPTHHKNQGEFFQNKGKHSSEKKMKTSYGTKN